MKVLYCANIIKLTVNQFKSASNSKMSLGKDKPQSRSRQTTQQDSSSDRQEELFIPKTNPAKHKTQLCKTYSELGYCPYEFKCRFAHGRQELIQTSSRTRLKARKCNGFWRNGCCPYGLRCQFGHMMPNWEGTAVLAALEAANQHVRPLNSKLLNLLA